jgi:hypothetical protein
VGVTEGFVSAARFALDARLVVKGSQLMLTDVPVGQLEIGLFTLAGRSVMQKRVKTMNVGSVELVALKALSPGTYIARVRLNGQQVQMSNQSIVIANR